MRGIFESLIVFGIMTGLLLPARLLFVEFVSDDWLGSFGVITAISLSIIVLAKKKKLGFFGPMLERQIYKFQKGKRGIAIFGESVFLLLVLGTMIVAIDQGNSIHSEYMLQNSQNVPMIDSPEKVLEITNEMTPTDWIVGFLLAPSALLTEFPKMSAAIASIDQSLDGWLMHFYTVGFVEYLELLGILIFYRVSFKRKISSATNQLYAKAAI
ncbi:hypothetical protein AAA799E16_01631 [Marine Group I thaumarchaeote SCGC AAA799-E16]|uniref:Uncharacterized protein n=5 Tax=Marine Group I TaxID=905826 RepID=A0A087S747_9ARCH|nr:hypothetical protein AAA799N04_01762 [Marine Group I thaumarchaeote SCGC AAA799-N04]KER05703.1 hypothetical protein AAA799E16_01631 [Marine Group I thaumarchaeote SCGC AAA799-E16]KFM16738.1 hypothetical protein AAA799D11_00549 [Marine Group I thaumarchaeote SCGC AAA799-D11]KFM18659.1 hypothetical protein SCCGRSA3_00992 [Marine Group I thaumarchaeote SCGC RSA3]KFM21551.1 hypothetical protein AAA799B03_00919 [Marine Group I thaumarchaeote SCGC AAA799-B03]